jgi:hypothetical protein
MIDYERFLDSFDIVDTESGDSDATLAAMQARVAPPRRDSEGGRSPLRGPRRATSEGTSAQSRSVR